MNQPPDFVLFLGRFHPLLVHLPIGMLMLGFVMELLGRRKKTANLRESTGFVWLMGAIAAWLSVFLGLMLAEGGGYNADTLGQHKWMGIGLAVLATLIWFMRRSQKEGKPGLLPKLYLPGIIVSMLLLTGTGHLGGSLTHGSDYLVQYAPQPIRSLAGLPPRAAEEEQIVIEDVNEALVFDQIIFPVVKQRCQSCHNEDKMKGGLRLDTHEKFLEGGEGGVIFVANRPNQSELFHRLTLPEEDEKHMPPEGKRPLTDEQIELIGWWIEQGAPLDKRVAELEVPEAIQTILEESFGPMAGKEQGVFAMQVEVADPEAVRNLSQRAGKVLPIAQEHNFVQVSFAKDSTPFGNADVQNLLPIAQQITWFDLRNTELTDFSFLAQLPNLSRLHLELSQVQDADLVHLAKLEHLEYLNLYGTEISDEGLIHLEGMESLRSLYLWQSKASEEAAKALVEKLPELEINLGWDKTIRQGQEETQEAVIEQAG
ncbi:MAG: c-type cytochrome domain-containing protein [Bacteroidota bacterium]